MNEHDLLINNVEVTRNSARKARTRSIAEYNRALTIFSEQLSILHEFERQQSPNPQTLQLKG